MEDENAVNPEENSEHFIAIIIECLALLNKIPETVEVLKISHVYTKLQNSLSISKGNKIFQVIKVQMQTELLKIIARTSDQIKRNPEKQATTEKSVSSQNMEIKIIGGSSPTESQTLLLELLNTVFDQLRLVAGAHSMALRSFSHVIRKYSLEVRLYEMPAVWSRIQAVVSLLRTNWFFIFLRATKNFHFFFFTVAIAVNGVPGYTEYDRRSFPINDKSQRAGQ